MSQSDATKMQMSRKTVQAVVHATDILRELGRAGKPVGVNALALAMNLPPSTVHRLLTSLAEREFVVQVPHTQEYTLGSALLGLLSDMVQQFDVRRTLRPVMERLNRLTQETIHLAVAVHRQIMDVDVIDSPQSLGVRRDVGSLLPVHATAVGKVFLAFSPTFYAALQAEELPLQQLTPHTVTEPHRLLEEIERVLRDGYAVNWGGRHEETAGAAVPIFGLDGGLVAVLGASGPIARFPSNDDLFQLGRTLLQETHPFSSPSTPESFRSTLK